MQLPSPPHGGIIDLIAAFSLILCSIHCQIRPLEQGCKIQSVIGMECRAYAAGGVEYDPPLRGHFLN